MAVEKSLGVVPNLYLMMSSSPSALGGWLGLNGALSKTLDARTHERIALAVAQINGCDYCLAAHTYLSLNLVKADAAEVALNRRGTSSDPKAAAAVAFAAKLVRERGKLSDADVQAVKAAGYTDAQVIEIVSIAVTNIFTNYLNMVAQTELDFPAVRLHEAA